jgi:hypothetical protein
MVRYSMVKVQPEHSSYAVSKTLRRRFVDRHGAAAEELMKLVGAVLRRPPQLRSERPFPIAA